MGIEKSLCKFQDWISSKTFRYRGKITIKDGFFSFEQVLQKYIESSVPSNVRTTFERWNPIIFNTFGEEIPFAPFIGHCQTNSPDNRELDNCTLVLHRNP